MKGIYVPPEPIRTICGVCKIRAELRDVSDLRGWTLTIVDGQFQWRCPDHREMLEKEMERRSA